MNIVFLIQNREAIPVRAIPLVTGWSISSEVTASFLAHRDPLHRMDSVQAFVVDEQGVPAPMLPKDWDGVDSDMQEFLTNYKTDLGAESGALSDWREKSVAVLPAGVFVWKDELSTAFLYALSEDRMEILGERAGDRALNWSPLISQKMHILVFEGCAAVADAATDAQPEAAAGRWPWGDHHTRLLGCLDAAARRYWGAGYDPSDNGSASTNATISDWLQQNHKVSRTMADAIASMLRPDGLPVGPRK